jgi:pyruvate formate lyase activating enzyme
MRIGGLQKLSLIDFPGKPAAVVFTQGCNFRCPFCHNRELVIPSFFQESISQEYVLHFLEERKDKLKGVVLSGGEPTLQEDLLPFLRKIKVMGYSIKLDTNASQPRVLKEIISRGLIDFIAVDIKAPLARYSELAGTHVNIDNIRESIDIVLKSRVGYLFRTTVPKPLLSPEDIEEITFLINGCRQYVVQEFLPRDTVLDTTLLDKGQYTSKQFQDLQKKYEKR